jgi:outer membrane protein OmpA-like peptidoglycan-associated protein
MNGPQSRRGRRSAVLALLAAGTVAACAAPPKPKVLAPPAPPVCADFDFPIYFEKGSDQLTEAARGEIAYAASRVKGCRLGTIEVVGLADADGAARRNLALSRQRAVAVAKILSLSNLPAPKFDIEALGEAGALTPTGDPEPLRRRTEVIIRASPPVAPAKPTP